MGSLQREEKCVGQDTRSEQGHEKPSRRRIGTKARRRKQPPRLRDTLLPTGDGILPRFQNWGQRGSPQMVGVRDPLLRPEPTFVQRGQTRGRNATFPRGHRKHFERAGKDRETLHPANPGPNPPDGAGRSPRTRVGRQGRACWKSRVTSLITQRTTPWTPFGNQGLGQQRTHRGVPATPSWRNCSPQRLGTSSAGRPTWWSNAPVDQ